MLRTLDRWRTQVQKKSAKVTDCGRHEKNNRYKITVFRRTINIARAMAGNTMAGNIPGKTPAA
jgi:hypothetical protein